MASSATVTTLAGVLLRLARRAIAVASSATTGVVRLARATAFWTAVVLPFVFLSLVARGSPVLADPRTVVLFVAVDVGALFVGHGHGTPARAEEGAGTPTPSQSSDALHDD